MMSLRRASGETSAPNSPTLFAHCSKSLSCVTPRSSVTASYLFRRGNVTLVLGPPASRGLTRPVVPSSTLIPLKPAPYLPSHFPRNLKFLYGSNRVLRVKG